MRAQGLPVNMIVLTALALLVLVVVAAFFITGMSGAAQQTTIVNATQAQCNSWCASLSVSANNYDYCEIADGGLKGIGTASDYMGAAGSGCDFDYGACSVILRNGGECLVENE